MAWLARQFLTLRPIILVFAPLLGATAGTQALAQLVLPGASAPPQGSAQPAAPLPSAPRPPPGPVPVKLAGDDTVIDKPLFLNGTKGRLVIERKDKNRLTATLVAVGEKISKPAEACGLDLGGGHALDLKPVGRPDGALRYSLDFPACPLNFDILDGAVLADATMQTCSFQEEDCRVEPLGLWGPPASTIEALKSIESDRSRADKAVRENFKALIRRTKGREEIKVVAAEQAGFTSERETLCRDYSRESAHGYCAARYTEWRAASLAARLNRLDGKPEGALVAAQPKPKPKPRIDAAAADGMTGAPSAPARPAAPAPAAPASRSIFDIFR